MFRFILASQSPRRRSLLTLLGYPFEVMPAFADEDSVSVADPAVNVVETARLKTAVIAAQLASPPSDQHFVIIAADTTVAHNGRMLNKPKDANEAVEMLLTLRDDTHFVHTGVSLLDLTTGKEVHGVHSAVVTMRPYSLAEIEAYVATGDPLDKAGAYAIQHPVFKPVDHIDGCYLGVMGLSLCHLLSLLDELGVPRLVDVTAVSQAHQGYPCPILPTDNSPGNV